MRNNIKTAGLKTINGVKKSIGIVTLKIKILNMEQTINVFVIDEENFDYDFLIGLDCIKKFRLTQNEKLEVTQNIDILKNKYNEKVVCADSDIIPDFSGSKIEGKI